MVPQEAWNTDVKQAPQFSFSPPFDLSHWASLVVRTVKNLPAMQETWAQPLGWEDPLEENMATHSSILAWRIPMNRETWWAAVHRVTKSQTRLSD